MKVAYARRALVDMAEIDAHIRAQDPETAKNVAREIQARCAALALILFSIRRPICAMFVACH